MLAWTCPCELSMCISSACMRCLYKSSSGMLLRFLHLDLVWSPPSFYDDLVTFSSGCRHEDHGQGLSEVLVRGSCRDLVKSSQGSLHDLVQVFMRRSCGDPRAMLSEAFAWSCAGACGRRCPILQAAHKLSGDRQNSPIPATMEVPSSLQSQLLKKCTL